MTTKHKELRLNLEEADDKCDNLFSLGKLSQVIAVANEYEMNAYWVDRVSFMEVILHTLGITEDQLVVYIENLYKMDLDFEYTEYITNDVPEQGVLRIQIVLHAKHQTEGGRLAQEIAACNKRLASLYDPEQRNALSALAYTVYVDGYDDDELEVDINDPESEDEDDPLCDVEGTCYCRKCVQRRAGEPVGDEDLVFGPGPDDAPDEDDEEDERPPINKMH